MCIRDVVQYRCLAKTRYYFAVAGIWLNGHGVNRYSNYAHYMNIDCVCLQALCFNILYIALVITNNMGIILDPRNYKLRVMPSKNEN